NNIFAQDKRATLIIDTHCMSTTDTPIWIDMNSEAKRPIAAHLYRCTRQWSLLPEQLEHTHGGRAIACAKRLIIERDCNCAACHEVASTHDHRLPRYRAAIYRYSRRRGSRGRSLVQVQDKQ